MGINVKLQSKEIFCNYMVGLVNSILTANMNIKRIAAKAQTLDLAGMGFTPDEITTLGLIRAELLTISSVVETNSTAMEGIADSQLF